MREGAVFFLCILLWFQDLSDNPNQARQPHHRQHPERGVPCWQNGRRGRKEKATVTEKLNWLR